MGGLFGELYDLVMLFFVGCVGVGGYFGVGLLFVGFCGKGCGCVGL